MQEDSYHKAANAITSLRIVFALWMVFCAPFSAGFWVCYVCAALSDMLDGPVARRSKQASAIGARLDSLADLVFAAAIAVVVIRYIHIPGWLWICALIIVVLRLISYAIGFHKYHCFASLHTWGNKATGALIFISPVLYILLGLKVTGIILCVVAFVSAFEELLINLSSSELERDRKSLFTR